MTHEFDQTIGYSPLENVDKEKMRHVIQSCKKVIESVHPSQPGDRLLVAGAGDGSEAIILAEEFNLMTIGVDLNIGSNRNQKENSNLSLQIQDLNKLAFSDESFSLIYSYHVLEHIPDPMTVLLELHRVLRPGGVLFMGFPNKHRLLSYFGTSQKASLWEKLSWNFNDFKYKISGKFENKLGAHAGFTECEFNQMSTKVFGVTIPVRSQYMHAEVFPV